MQSNLAIIIPYGIKFVLLLFALLASSATFTSKSSPQQVGRTAENTY